MQTAIHWLSWHLQPFWPQPHLPHSQNQDAFPEILSDYPEDSLLSYRRYLYDIPKRHYILSLRECLFVHDRKNQDAALQIHQAEAPYRNFPQILCRHPQYTRILLPRSYPEQGGRRNRPRPYNDNSLRHPETGQTEFFLWEA